MGEWLIPGEAIKLGWLAAGPLPFLQAFYDAFLDNLAAEVSLVEILAQDRFMHDLEFAQCEFGRQKFEADIRVIQFVSKALVGVLDDLAVIEG